MTRLSEVTLLADWSDSIAGESPPDEDAIAGAAQACCPTCGQSVHVDLRLDGAERSAYANGGFALLAPMEFALLAALHKSGRNWLTRDAAIAAVWKNRGLRTPASIKNSLANLVLLLRKQLRPLEFTIKAHPNRGYRLTILRP
jgi:DNA-binding response OmpR family regulator